MSIDTVVMRYTQTLAMAQPLEVMISTSRIMLAAQHPRTQILVTHTVHHLATVLDPATHERCLLVVTHLPHLKLKFSILFNL